MQAGTWAGVAAALVVSAQAHAQPGADAGEASLNNIDVLTVVGSASSVSDVAGSITYLPPEKLEIQTYTDINRILRAVPGVNLQEEDGFGLRPNIGLRGSGLDRSAKVLIMEDGVLLAPAPYAAPAAYYFPFSNRMHAVEVTKGPSTVKYGPNTTAGAIQFFSTPIPDEPAAYAMVLASSQERALAHAWAGGRFAPAGAAFDVGVLVETYQDRAEGFKEIEIGDTGFALQDYVAKIGLFSPKDARRDHSLVFKFQFSDERSDETYLGLTEADIERTPFLRYNASQRDEMNTEHYTYQLTHNVELANAVELATIVYRTDFARNWEKLDRFDNADAFFDDPLLSVMENEARRSACNSLDEILVDPVRCAHEFDVLRGPAGLTSPDDVLGIRQNNREYYAQGVQTAMKAQFQAFGLEHDLVASLRYHEDSEDRFQEQDQYRIDNGTVVKTTDNAPGTQSNRLSEAQALSLYIENTMRSGWVSVTGGLRLESVDTKQERWDTPDRSLPPTSVRENSYDILLPSVSVLVDVTDEFAVLAGAHRGYAAASVSSSSQEPEESIAYEAGMRWSGRLIDVEAIGFFNDYSNLIAACTNSTGGSECVIGDTDNAGAADVYGAEIVASTDLAALFGDAAISAPLALAYTYTETEFKSTVDSDIFGDITAGDELPYVPHHQLYVSTGLEAARWGLHADISVVGEARAAPGAGAIPAAERIDARTLVDLAAFYEVRDGVRVRVKVENLFDADYVAARRPYGARPGKPREIFAGLTLSF